MDLEPRLHTVVAPAAALGAVLVLHGGGARRGASRVSPAQLSVLRMIPIARLAARIGRGELAVFRLLNSRRGWDASHTPVADAHWALEQIAARYGRVLPTCLIGHSLGGRAAVLSAARPEVRSVAALAAWVYPDDAPDDVADRSFLFVHGSADRIASPERSAALARRLADRNDVSYVTVKGGRHAMLSGGLPVDRLAAEFASVTLLGGTFSPRVAQAFAGELWASGPGFDARERASPPAGG